MLDDLDEDVEPAEVWGCLWESSELPMKDIEAYLSKWHDRFDLFDSERPFMQVPDLKKFDKKGGTSEKASSVSKVIADVPDGEILFSLRSGNTLNELSFAEAVRWLVHAQAFDTSGIKSGVFNDPLSSGSRSMSRGGKGVAWAGQLGGIYFKGDTLRETLLLNSVLWGNDESELFSDNDLPVWEKPLRPFGSLEETPTGTANIYTWQSRRVRLITSDNSVSGVVLTYGDVIDCTNKHKVEPMTSWETPVKNKHEKQPVFNPIKHQANKALWRGLSSTFLTSKDAGDNANTLCPGVVSWVKYLTSENGGRKVPLSRLLSVHGIGIQYDKNYSTIMDVVDDEVTLSTFLLSPEGLQLISLANNCVRETECAIDALCEFSRNLCRAVGGDSSAGDLAANETGTRAYFEIDAMFRTWLTDLCAHSSPDIERINWRRQARTLFKSMSKDLLSEVDAAAIVGSPEKDKRGSVIGWITAAKAERIFSSKLRTILPLESDLTREEESTVGR